MKIEYRKEILSVLSASGRSGIEKLCGYLESSDFFTAPASTRFHLAYPGGLAEHSWNVYNIFKEKNTHYNLGLNDGSVALCGLLHDVCKIGVYKKGKKNVKEDNKWIEKEVWQFEDPMPFGHGEKSVYIIQKYIELSEEEAMIIRWHMGFTEPREIWPTFRNAIDQYPVIIALHCADLEASSIIEARGEAQ
ncbi:MAG: HD domain-containing protein [Chitinivibrionales bacterium]